MIAPDPRRDLVTLNAMHTPDILRYMWRQQDQQRLLHQDTSTFDCFAISAAFQSSGSEAKKRVRAGQTLNFLSIKRSTHAGSHTARNGDGV
ncbi:hypothetical protein FKM82_004626 [Ascaphus truei]